MTLLIEEITESNASDTVKVHLAKLAKTLANNNRYARRVTRLKDGPSYAEDYLCISNVYTEMIEEHGLEKVLYNLERANRHVHWMVGHLKNDLESIVGEIILTDLYAFMPKIDDYVENDGQGEVYEATKELSRDKEGMITIDDRFRLENHGIIFNEILIYYHQFLRRYFTSNFVDTPALIKLAYKAGIKTRIQLDPLRITTPNQLENIIEEDYWFGKKFDVVKLNDENYVGVTVHGRGEDAREDLDLTYKIDRTVFYIKNYKNGKKEIQIEEIIPLDGNVGVTQKYALHRFAHMIWNKEKELFEHLDCSVLIYSKQDHTTRISYDWKPPRGVDIKAKRLKLLRLDGDIGLELMKDVVNQFFRYNEMVDEYFTGTNYRSWRHEDELDNNDNDEEVKK